MTRMQMMTGETIGRVMNLGKGDIISGNVNQDRLGLTPEKVKPHVKQQKIFEIQAMWCWPLRPRRPC